MRAAVLAVVLGGGVGVAHASPWQQKCAALLDDARAKAVAIEPAYKAVQATPDGEGESQEHVKIRLPRDVAAPIVLARRDSKPAGSGAGGGSNNTGWDTFEETTPSGEYHLMLQRIDGAGSALLNLTIWKKPTAQKLADVFKPALDACIAAAGR
jgi:hypothetical protein